MTVTKSLLLVGVGGQGIILFTKVLADGLLRIGYDVKTSEIHGMAQRGGVVTTHVRYGEKVYAPNIARGQADTIVAFEKVEAVRALPYLKTGGTVVVDDCEIYPLPVLSGEARYPHDAIDLLKTKLANVRVIPALRTAQSLGNGRAQNMCLLGTLVRLLGLEGLDWPRHISGYVPAKWAEVNVAAFTAGAGMVK